jgi:hypothetical protein
MFVILRNKTRRGNQTFSYIPGERTEPDCMKSGVFLYS